MSDVLAGQHGLQDAIRPTEHPGLAVVLSGTAQPSPSELLSLTFDERDPDLDGAALSTMSFCTPRPCCPTPMLPSSRGLPAGP